ncbi:MAG: adenylyltransferase/cytidyltransferase family protein [Promethearchaeota archaeon]
MNKKVLIAGTFDILHPGHVFLINEAAKLGDVYVIVATDKNREKTSGKKPIIPEEQRLEIIKSLKNVKKAQLGRRDNNWLLSIIQIKPDIILLGPNQRVNLNYLKDELSKIGFGHIIVKRLDKYYDKYDLSSSSLIKKKIINSNVGCENKTKILIYHQ